MEKQCIHCKKKKNIDLFVSDSRSKDGKSNVCKMCKKGQVIESSRYKDYKAKHKKLYAENSQYRESMKAKANKFRIENNEKVLLSQAKSRSNRNGLGFNLELSDIIIPDKCPILNVKLKRGVGKKDKQSPSIDRIDNSKGYITGNVRVISYLANHMKADATPEELHNFSLNIINYINGMI